MKFFTSPCLALTLVFSLSASCKKSHDSDPRPNNPSPEAQSAGQDPTLSEPPRTLVESRILMTLDQKTLGGALASSGIEARNGARIYRVSYNTVGIDGTALIASGIVLVPNTDAPSYPWISLQHGTLTALATAPSLNPREGLAEVSQGFVTVVADYLGYGDSTAHYHPFIIEAGYTRSLVDMMRAARELAAAENFNLGTLFLKGYSEGGYATVALQKELETNHSDEFVIKASSPSAGPLDVEQTGELILQNPIVDPANIPFLILSYNHWLANDSLPLDALFVPSLDSITKAHSGAYTPAQISEMLPKANAELVESSFTQDFLSDSPQRPESQTLHKLLKSQSLIYGPWFPKAPTRMYHCEDDEEIPVAVTNKAMQIFKDAGSPVESVIIPSADPATPYRHGTCPAILAPIQWFVQILNEAKP